MDTDDERLFWVNLSYACYGLVVVDGYVVDAPPIARWMIGKDEEYVADWLTGKRATVMEVEGVR